MMTGRICIYYVILQRTFTATLELRRSLRNL